MDKYILVTGGLGQIGSNYIKWLSKNTEYGIIIVDNLVGGYLENVQDIPNLIIYIRDAQEDLSDIFEKYNVVYCYAMAAFAAEGLSNFMRKYSYSNNILITANLVNHCIKYNCKLIYLSSMSVYGRNSVPFTEDQIPTPIDVYGISKFAGELDVQVAGEHHGMKWAIIRPHNVIGPNVNMFDPYRNVLGIWVRQILNNQPITIYGTGEQKRAFSFVKDYCETFLKVAENDYPDPIFNVGGDDYRTLNEVSDLLFEVTGKNTGKVYLEPRHEVFLAYSDHTKIKQVTGFEANTTLAEMLLELWNWAKVQPNRPVKEWDKFEIENGLYSYWKK